MMRRTGKRAFVPATATDDTGGGGMTNSGVAGVSGIAAALPDQVQRLLNGPIGEGEQHGVSVLRGLVPDAVPGRHDEDVPLAPLDHEILARARRDNTAPASLDRGEDGSACGPVRRCVKAF